MNIETRLDEVRNEYLRRMTQGNNALLREVECYTTSHIGKMLRPRMLLTAAATQGEACFNSHRTLLLAVCVEMLHNASLLHDDVIDRADNRRGQLSVNARWSNGIAVLVGDWHLTQIMELLEEIDEHLVTRKVNYTVRSMVESELMQQEFSIQQANPKIQQISEQDYLRIIDGKTANLFALAAELGNPEYHDFGLHYGRLFQLRDDIADNESTPWTEALIDKETSAIKNMPKILNI